MAISEALRYFVQYDQVDATGLAGLEHMVRRIIMIEMAVNRNPKAPDWEGLEMVVAARVNDTGGVSVPKFMNWVGDQQKTEAQVLKQGRLIREERDADRKKNKNNQEKA